MGLNWVKCLAQSLIHKSRKTMVAAIVIIISISVIFGRKALLGMGPRGLGSLAGMSQGPAATQTPVSSWAASISFHLLAMYSPTCSKSPC